MPLLYIVRHAQPVIAEAMPGAAAEFPPGDPGLTELGRRQAEMLAAELVGRGFAGTVFSSPYLRTIQTALPLCRKLDCSMRLISGLQEISFHPHPNTDGSGLLNLPPGDRRFVDGSELDSNWPIAGPEDEGAVISRTERFRRSELPRTDGDVLVVAHGATVRALMSRLFEEMKTGGENGCFWNCALNIFETDGGRAVRLLAENDVSYLPPKAVSSNLHYRFPRPA